MTGTRGGRADALASEGRLGGRGDAPQKTYEMMPATPASLTFCMVIPPSSSSSSFFAAGSSFLVLITTPLNLLISPTFSSSSTAMLTGASTRGARSCACMGAVAGATGRRRAAQSCSESARAATVDGMWERPRVQIRRVSKRRQPSRAVSSRGTFTRTFGGYTQTEHTSTQLLEEGIEPADASRADPAAKVRTTVCIDSRKIPLHRAVPTAGPQHRTHTRQTHCSHCSQLGAAL